MQFQMEEDGMIRRMCVTKAIAQVNCGLEYMADKMARLLRLGLALAQCPISREIGVGEEKRRMTTDNSSDMFARETRA